MKQNISYVIKRNGLVEMFNRDKITNTINNVTKSSNYLAKNQLNGLTDLVVSKLENNASDIKISAEHISSVIKETLASVNKYIYW